MFKILMCACKIEEPKKKKIPFKISTFFHDCPCNEDHQIFATFCEKCRMNFVGFPRNYFASMKCSCVFVGRHEICKHCMF